MRTGLSGSVPTPDAPGASDGAPGGAPAGNASWRRPRPFSRPQWYPVVGAVAVAALLVGVAMALLTLSRGPQARPLAHDCGLVMCGASLPPAVHGAAVPGTAAHSTAPVRQHQRRALPPALAPAVRQRARPAAPTPAPSTVAPSTVAPSPAPSPATWTRHRHHHHHHHHDQQQQDG